jgi:hypothetical protein
MLNCAITCSKDQGIVISVLGESPEYPYNLLVFLALSLAPTLNFVEYLDPERTQSEMSCSRISYYDFLRPGRGKERNKPAFHV